METIHYKDRKHLHLVGSLEVANKAYFDSHLCIMRPPWILLKLMVFNNKKFLECIHQESGELWTQSALSSVDHFYWKILTILPSSPARYFNIFRWLEFYWNLSPVVFVHNIEIYSNFFIEKKSNLISTSGIRNSVMNWVLLSLSPGWLINYNWHEDHPMPPKNNEGELVRFHHEKMEYILHIARVASAKLFKKVFWNIQF